MSNDPSSSRRFAIALSFPGEHRAFVKEVADHLPELYRAQSELIVLFLCPEYAAKRWCNLEWRHIRDLLASVDEDRIMFLRYGYDGDFEKLGILRGDGTVNFDGRLRRR